MTLKELREAIEKFPPEADDLLIIFELGSGTRFQKVRSVEVSKELWYGEIIKLTTRGRRHMKQ